MRRYELMLVLRPDTADDRVQQILDRTTRGIAAAEGQIIKVSPGAAAASPIRSAASAGVLLHRRLQSPSAAIEELERGLNITEEVMRHLVTRVERPVSSRRWRQGRGGCRGGRGRGDLLRRLRGRGGGGGRGRRAHRRVGERSRSRATD